MTRRAARTFAALVLATGLIFSAVMADAAPKVRAFTDRIAENAAIAPRHEPAPPVNHEEFKPNPNVQSVHFDFDRATIRARDARILDGDARWLRSNQPYEVVIEGFADERGTKPYNVALAKRRAMAVRNHLIARGVQPDRIVLVSYGEARPDCRAKQVKSEACWSKNRRADILVRSVNPQNP
jgi:peptidoglycan-associated lipoprotein